MNELLIASRKATSGRAIEECNCLPFDWSDFGFVFSSPIFHETSNQIKANAEFHKFNLRSQKEQSCEIIFARILANG
jgi:hypothetical protein